MTDGHMLIHTKIKTVINRERKTDKATDNDMEIQGSKLNTTGLWFVLVVLVSVFGEIRCQGNHVWKFDELASVKQRAQGLEHIKDSGEIFTRIDSLFSIALYGQSTRDENRLLESFRSRQNGAPPKSFNVSEICLEHTFDVLKALFSKPVSPWAIQMVDAAGKLESGILEGSVSWLGSFDECRNVSTEEPFQTQYCTAMIGNATSLNNVEVAAMSFGGVSLTYGICVPDSCLEEDVRGLVNLGLIVLPKDYEAISVTCQPSSLPLDSAAIGMICFLSVLGFVLLVATVYDILIHQPHLQKVTDALSTSYKHGTGTGHADGEDENTPLIADQTRTHIQHPQLGMVPQILIALSIYTNGSKLLSTKTTEGSLGCVHGMRFFSMSWVLLGHTYAFGMGGFKNITALLAMMKRWSFQAIINASVSVDSFFFLSGMLASYLILREMKNKGGPLKINWLKYYFHRFWRLTPPYMLVLGVEVGLVKYFYSGPLWPSDGFDPNCKKYWWRNILYINNLFSQEELCVGWSWYLSNDMQFFVITPLLIIPFFKSVIAGLAVTLSVMTASFIVTGVQSAHLHFPPDMPGLLNRPQNLGSWFEDEYVKPWCRIGPYLVGVLVGYILYRTDRKVKMHWGAALLGWILAAACNLSVLYGLYGESNGHLLSDPTSAFYSAVHRSAWAAGLGWVIIACTSGYGGFVNTFLSWKGFIPLSRLTYMAYLVHPVVMAVYYNGLRSQHYMTDIMVVYLFLGHLGVSYIIAFVSSLAIEAPMMGLEKVLLK